MNRRFLISILLLSILYLIPSYGYAEGSWVDVTKSFDKSIPFRKIRVRNYSSSYSNYCCVFFSTTPNNNTTSDTYYNINFYRLTIGDGVKQDDYNGYIYVRNCNYVGDSWYEYEFKQPVYFSHYQSNAPTNRLKAYVETNSAVRKTVNVSTAGTLSTLS